MEDLVFVTGNVHKAEYLAKWLGHDVPHVALDLPEIQSLSLQEVVEYKVREAYSQLQKPVLVEDVSLRIHAFGQLPGTYIKWFLHEVGVDGIIAMLQAFEDRSATACVMYGLYDGKTVEVFEGSMPGTISDKPRSTGDQGWHSSLSWNSIFVPEGSAKTYAEMTDDEMKPVSHRARAIAKLQAYLEENS